MAGLQVVWDMGYGLDAPKWIPGMAFYYIKPYWLDRCNGYISLGDPDLLYYIHSNIKIFLKSQSNLICRCFSNDPHRGIVCLWKCLALWT
jgi:hypothetical protein